MGCRVHVRVSVSPRSALRFTVLHVPVFAVALDMSTRGRSRSPHPLRDEDVDMDNGSPPVNALAKVVVVTNLTRNVMESHLQSIFGFYGEIVKTDLPLYGKCKYN